MWTATFNSVFNWWCMNTTNTVNAMYTSNSGSYVPNANDAYFSVRYVKD